MSSSSSPSTNGGVSSLFDDDYDSDSMFPVFDVELYFPLHPVQAQPIATTSYSYTHEELSSSIYEEPVHDPLPGSPAAEAQFAAAQVASEQVDDTQGNEPTKTPTSDCLPVEGQDTESKNDDDRNENHGNIAPPHPSGEQIDLQEDPFTGQSPEQGSQELLRPEVDALEGDHSDGLPPEIQAFLGSVVVRLVGSGERGEVIERYELVPREQLDQYLRQFGQTISSLGDIQEPVQQQPQDGANDGSNEEGGQHGAKSFNDGEVEIPGETLDQDHVQGDADIEVEGGDSEDMTPDPAETTSEVPQEQKHASSSEPSARAPVLPGKKKQTKAPYKAPPVPPRATPLVWPEFYLVPLPAAVRANPAGYEAAHQVIANAKNIEGLRSATKGTGPIKQSGGEGKGDWKAGVRVALLNDWIRYKHNLVLFTNGMQDYAAQNQWFQQRSQQERDEFRIWARERVEAGLQPKDRDEVQRLRDTPMQVVAGTLNASVANGTWTHPTLGGVMGAPMNAVGGGIASGSTSGRGNGYMAGLNAGSSTGLGGGHSRANAVVPANSRQSRKRDREVQEDDDDEYESRGVQDLLRPSKKRRQSDVGMNAGILPPLSPSAPPPSYEENTQRTIKRERDDSDQQNLQISARPNKKARRLVGGTAEVDLQNGIGQILNPLLLERPPGMRMDEWYQLHSQSIGGPMGVPQNQTQRRLPPRNGSRTGPQSRNSNFTNGGQHIEQPPMSNGFPAPQEPQIQGFERPSTYGESNSSMYPDPTEFEQSQHPRYQAEYGLPPQDNSRSQMNRHFESGLSSLPEPDEMMGGFEDPVDYDLGSWVNQAEPSGAQRERGVVTAADWITTDMQEAQEMARLTNIRQRAKDRAGKYFLRGG